MYVRGAFFRNILRLFSTFATFTGESSFIFLVDEAASSPSSALAFIDRFFPFLGAGVETTFRFLVGGSDAENSVVGGEVRSISWASFIFRLDFAVDWDLFRLEGAEERSMTNAVEVNWLMSQRTLIG